jgi:hypothetical protein
MRARMLTLGLLLALGGGLTRAHGSKVHIRGTIEKISAESVQVKTLDGRTVEVKLAASTVYVLHADEERASPQVGVRKLGDEDKPARVSDLAVGDLVVIHATPKGSALEADEVKFSLSRKPKS